MPVRPTVLMMIESSRESGRKLISGIAEYAQNFGPWNFIWEPGGVASLHPRHLGGEIHGIMTRDLANIEPFVEQGIPTVFFRFNKTDTPGVINVHTDDKAIGERIVEHVVSRGFKHFAYCGYQGLIWSEHRGKAYKDALRSLGFDAAMQDMPPAEISGKLSEAQKRALHTWLKALPKPVAMMAANDDLGQQLVQLCREANLRVPEDCAIVGVDNDPVVCGICNPPLSSVVVEQQQAGYLAAAALDRQMKGNRSESNSITATVGDVIVRQSSDLFAIDDVGVTKALRFIQENVHRSISVEEIAKASGLSRRALERRFSLHLPDSVNQHYRQARANHLAKLIANSDLSLEAIAEQCEFSEPSNLSRFFSSLKGETPSAYRRRVTSGVESS